MKYTDHKKFFAENWAKNIEMRYYDVVQNVSVEDLYQMFKARLAEEAAQGTLKLLKERGE